MYDRKRTRLNLWTPSLPSFETRFFSSISSSPLLALALYRLVRLSYLLLTTPLHLSILALSLPPLSLEFPTIFDPNWSFTQKLVYPFLRRIIWATADVGDPNILTRSTGEGDTPLWAWMLEEFTVRIGRGARVEVRKERGVEMPKEVWERGWIGGKGSELLTGNGIESEPVNLFWFEKKTGNRRNRGDGYRARSGERIVLYLFGGGFVCGSPGEGGRCYKIARETGLRVVGVNYRRSTSRKGAFPAALQDALTCYFHLTVELGFKDVIIAGDSAGAGLALNVLQYLAGSLHPSLSSSSSKSSGSPKEQSDLVLPSALLLLSPWCDLTLESFPHEQNMTDIILPSICSNSVRAYFGGISHERDRNGSTGVDKFDNPAQHPWFSPSLRASFPSLQAISKAYPPSNPPLRILLSLGTSELFYHSLSSLADNLQRVEASSHGSVEVEIIEGKGEVHAFPLVPEWVSPQATRAWERLRIWFRE